MAKKGFGKIMALATIAGAAAVGISYLKKYKSFNKELEKEFHDFEGDEQDFFDDEDENQEEDGPFTADDSDFEDDDPFEEDEGISFSSADPTEEEGQPSRKYISLHADAYDVKLAAKDIFAAAGEMAGAAKNVLKDTAVILTDTAFEAAQAAKDAAQIARAKLGEKADSYRERQAAREKESQEDSKDANPSPQKEEELSQDGVPQKPATQRALRSGRKRRDHHRIRGQRRNPPGKIYGSKRGACPHCRNRQAGCKKPRFHLGSHQAGKDPKGRT